MGQPSTFFSAEDDEQHQPEHQPVSAGQHAAPKGVAAQPEVNRRRRRVRHHAEAQDEKRREKYPRNLFMRLAEQGIEYVTAVQLSDG